MALVRRLEKESMQRDAVHGETSCTYKIFSDHAGSRYLQIDTFGSAHRKFRGKKSQTVQFGPEAIAQLKQIIQDERL